MWCGRCYEAGPDDPFPVRLPRDEAGNPMKVRKSDTDRYLYARRGDSFMTSFQCDLCHFRNLQGRDPVPQSGKDSKLLAFIRRATLDSFWSRESGTVSKNLGQLKLMCRAGDELGLHRGRMFPEMGPLPLEDTVGMGIAVCVLRRSLDPGRNEDTVQFSSASQAKTAFSNMWRASLEGMGRESVMARDRTKMFLTTCPTTGDWFERFALGMHKRMGDNVKQDEAISMPTMLELMKIFEQDYQAMSKGGNSDKIAEVLFPAAFVVIGYCAALRGEEVPMMDLVGTRDLYDAGIHHKKEELRHVVIPLSGRFKNEVGELYHIIPLVLETTSGLKPGVWVGRLLEWYAQREITNGWIFRDEHGFPVRAADYDYEFCRRIAEVQLQQPELIQPDLDVYDIYSLRRSLRRGSDSQAIAQNVDPADIDLNNRWRTVEKAGTRKANFNRMQHHYADIKILLPALLQYSRAL